MTSRKRGNNEGSVYLDKSRNLWRAAVTLPDGRRVRVSGATRQAAAEKLTALQTQLAAGLPTGDTDRLRPFLAWWLLSLEAKVAAGSKSSNTVSNARWACEKWVVPALGSKRLRELEPEDVETLLARMAAAGRSASTVNRVRTVLGQALAVAERRNKVSRNVARIAEMPATWTAVGRRSLTARQAEVLLEAAAGQRLEGLYVTGLMLGLRPGELCALRWVDVDLAAGSVTVQGSLKHEAGVLRLGDTKTAKSRRNLSLPDRVAAVLRAHRTRQKQERLRAGAAWHDSGLVFTTSIGTPINPANLRRSFRDLTEQAGLGHWTPNELRHSAASLLSASGVPLEIIADVLGHASTRMLEQHYRHQVKPAIDAHVGAMDRMYG